MGVCSSAANSDGTFHQLRPLSKLKGVKTLYSFDLKSATDRVPASECAVLLEKLRGADVALSWTSLLYRPFVIPASFRDRVEPKVDEVVFTTGTPLGSLSSWGVFALWHHLLVQQAAYHANKKLRWFANYAILG